MVNGIFISYITDSVLKILKSRNRNGVANIIIVSSIFFRTNLL